MTTAPAAREAASAAKRRRLVMLGVFRSLLTTVALVVLYYLLPLDHVKNVPVTLMVGLVILVVVALWQVRLIRRSPYPGLRAIESLASTLPLFLLLFAAAYVIMAGASPENFSTHSLTRTNALYFTVTVVTTVGFGDITATSQTARLVVTVQMLLDLLAVGLVVRAFISTAQSARRRTVPQASPGQDGDAQ